MRSPEYGARQTAPCVAHDGGGIEEISDRLTSLAERIDEYNTARKNSLTSSLRPARPVDDYLPAFLNSINLSADEDILPASARLGAEVNMGLEPPKPHDIDANGRHWPILSSPAMPTPAALKSIEDQVRAQSAELRRCHTQIAELTNIRQTQANELQSAAEQIDLIGKALDELRLLARERESDIAKATRKLIESQTEKVALEGQIAAERKQAHQLSLRLLNAEGVLNNKTVDAATYREAVEYLKSELESVKQEAATREAELFERLAVEKEELTQAASRREAELLERLAVEKEELTQSASRRQAELLNQLTAEKDSIKQEADRHQSELVKFLNGEKASIKQEADRHHAEVLKELAANFEYRIDALNAQISERDAIIQNVERSNRELAECCDSLSRKVSALETLQQRTGDMIETQVGYIEFLETVLNVERDNSQATIKELIAEFQRARDEIEAREQAAAEPPQNVVQMPPQPAEHGPSYADDAKMVLDMITARSRVA